MLIDAFGWRSVFAFALLAGAAITLAAYLWIGETRPQAGHLGGKGGILRDYVELFKSPKFVGYVLQSGLNTASFMTLASASASLMQELLQRSASEFGLYFLLFPLGFFLGNFVSSRIGSRSSSEVMVLSGSVLAFLAIFVQAMLLLSGMLTPLTLFIPGFLVTFSQGISLPYAQVGAMAIVPRIAGTAAGVGVFMQNMGAAIFTQLYGLFADGTPLPMVAIMSCSGMLCLAAGAMPILCGPRPVRG
jgi:DHA1 family bicyclomycin/chloramphenicol resistance-like MFS transporter